MNDQVLTTDEVSLKAATTEKINGVYIRVGTLDEFAKEVFGVTLKRNTPGNSSEKNEGWPIVPGGLWLGIEKFKTHAHKWYRLVWVGRGKAWLAAEDIEPYRRHRDVLTAGEKLANETGVILDRYSR